ncbi:MAG: hypothetical protein QM765_18735 [Myxococcales bacterium]
MPKKPICPFCLVVWPMESTPTTSLPSNGVPSCQTRTLRSPISTLQAAAPESSAFWSSSKKKWPGSV